MKDITIDEYLAGKQWLPPIGTTLPKPSVFRKGKIKFLEEMYEPAIKLLNTYTYFPFVPIKNTGLDQLPTVNTSQLRVRSVGLHEYNPDLTTFVLYFECNTTRRLFKVDFIDSRNQELDFDDIDSQLFESIDDDDDVYKSCYAMENHEYLSLVRKLKIDSLLGIN